MVTDKGRKPLPPYVSYRTFRTFIDGLQAGIPARIDRSYWGERDSGSTGTQLITALRFLALIDEIGTPMTRLRALVTAKGFQRTEALKQIANSAYDFLSSKSLDPQVATYGQLEEAFQSIYQVSGGVVPRSFKNFLTILKSDVVFPLPFFIKKKPKTPHTNREKNFNPLGGNIAT